MQQRAQRQGRGCFFYGCLTMFLIFIGVLVGVYFGTRKAVRLTVQNYTAAGPAEIPQLKVSAEEQEQIARRLEEEARAAASSSDSEPLVLDETELNVITRQAPSVVPYQEQIYLQPEGDELKAQLSIPLDQFKPWRELLDKVGAASLTNRYFNGTAILNPFVTNGTLHVTIKDLIVNGSKLPGKFTGRLDQQNFAPELKGNPALSAVAGKIRNVRVVDGKLIVDFKEDAVGTGTNNASGPAEPAEE